jgi:hypothetical protein
MQPSKLEDCSSLRFESVKLRSLRSAPLAEIHCFDVVVERELNGVAFAWPSDAELANLSASPYHQDLRAIDRAQAQSALIHERELVVRFQAATTFEEAEAEVVEMRESLIPESDHWGEDILFGLDLGVASAVLAISAVGCIPVASCNGGAFGGTHAAVCPIVAFFMKPGHQSLLLACATRAGVGLRVCEDGQVQVYASSVLAILDFADELLRA